MVDTEYRESALEALLVTIRGVHILGIVSAFWRIVAGMFAFMAINGGSIKSNKEQANG